MLAPVVEKRRKDRSVIYRLNRTKKKGEYHINPESSQAKYLKQITLDGFASFPRTLYPTGFGFKVSGTQLLQALFDKYGARLRVTLSKEKLSSVAKGKRTVRVTLNEAALLKVNRVVSQVKRQRGSEIKSLVAEFLGDELPKQFEGTGTGALKYQPNTIADLLEDPEVRAALSEKDADALKATYPDLVKEMDFTLRSTKKVKFMSESIKATQRVYIEKVIDEFESKLAGASTEAVWQTFLRSHILTLLNTYAFVIEKQSVQLDGKYPDFMLVDTYGYIDVYEIKRPQTALLRFDRSRSNFFWDAELAKAIVQTEKYISSVERNRFELEAKFRTGSIDVRVVRPRGFVIAGRRSDLKIAAMQEDFRVLNDSLKNIDVICFDDLLDNLRALYERLTADVQ